MLMRWVRFMYGSNTTIRERLFRIILSLAFVSTALAFFVNILLKVSLSTIIPMGLIAIAALFSLLIAVKFHKMNLSAWILGVLVIGYLLPQVFISSGGIESGCSLWLVLGLVYIWMLFSGRNLVLALICTSICYAALYVYTYVNPDVVKPMQSDFYVHVDSFVAVLMVGIVVGIIIKFQTVEFTKEKERNEKQTAEIERISQSKSAFFANMSHEIRTPINTIIGLNEMILREQNVSDEIAENAVNIQNASKMLLSLINDILDLSKLESGKMEIIPAQYETGAMFSELVNIIWVRAHEKNLDFRINISPELPSMLYGDEVRIKQVLINILTNAVKYTETGSINLSAKCEDINDNMVRLHISVQDTGIGIKKEDIDELFSSFRRVDQERNNKIEGTGLGLSISKQLVDMMGGEIAIDSIYKKGSTFTVTLDQQVVNASPVGSLNFMLKSKVLNRSRYKQSFEAPEARILIVDDNAMNRLVACKLLRNTKVQIDTAAGGVECLEKTKEKSYNVIFMDDMMPDMDGRETMDQVRSQVNGYCQKTPVIALTANAMSGAETIYMERGFDGYLAKPINGTLFEATLLKYLPRELIEYAVNEGDSDASNETIMMDMGNRKKKVKITTDCVCDVPKEWLDHYNIKSMFYYLYTNEGRFYDVQEVSPSNLVSYMGNPENDVRSDCPPVEEYENFFADALGEAENVIHITMASQVGKGYDNAVAAAHGFDHVTVVDSGHLSSGMGIMVIEAAKMLEEGDSYEEICSKLAVLRDKVSTSFIVPSAERMYRNGRINRAVYQLCEWMSLHPIMGLSQSRLRLLGMRAGSINVAYKKYISMQLHVTRKIDPSILFITYQGCSMRQLEEIKKEVEKHMHFERIELQKASAVISSNCGMGAFGLIYMKKR